MKKVIGLVLSLVMMMASPAAARLDFVEVYRDVVGGVDSLDGAHPLALSPDGTQVYVRVPPGPTC